MYWLFCVCSIQYLYPILCALTTIFVHILYFSPVSPFKIFPTIFSPQYCSSQFLSAKMNFLSLFHSTIMFYKPELFPVAFLMFTVFFFLFLEPGRHLFLCLSSFSSSTIVFPFLDFIFISSLHLSFLYTPPTWHGRLGYTIVWDQVKHVFSCYKYQIQQRQKTVGTSYTDHIFRKILIIKWQVPVFSFFFSVCFYLYPSSSNAAQ